MPQIPVYESQVSAGLVPKTPEATADDFGAQSSKAIVGATQAGLDLDASVITARHAAETSRGEADAIREIDAIKQMAKDDDDPAMWPDRVKQRLDITEAKYRALSDGAYRTAALGTIRSCGPTFLATARVDAAKREATLHQNDLTADTDYYIGQAATASNDLERQSYINLAKTAIARANAGGYVSQVDALARLRSLPGRIEKKQVEALTASDPAAAVEALDDKKRFRDIDPAMRYLLRERAMVAQQKASFATMSTVQRGIADGTKTRDDVDALFKDGTIGKATREWLDGRIKEAAKERAEKVEGQQRVDTVLRDGGKLDPRKAKDQAAADAHHDAVVAPANPDSPTLVSYIRRVGVVPKKVAQSIKGGLASDEPQQVVNAANLVRELGKDDAKLIEGFGAQRRKFANAVMDGIDGGLSPKRAIDLADKSHGQPDVTDDDDTETVDANGRSADQAEKANDKENSNSSTGGAGNNSTTAKASYADAISETVGPEIEPVGGAQDSANKIAEPDMVDRF